MDSEAVEAVAEAQEVIEETRADAAQEVASAVVQAVGTHEAMIESQCEEHHAEVIDAIENVAEIIEETKVCEDENAVTLETIRQQLSELRESNLSLRESFLTMQATLAESLKAATNLQQSTDSESSNPPLELETEEPPQSVEAESPVPKIETSKRRRARML